MFFTTPTPAKAFSINTNSRDLDYQVSTKAILQIIKNNPQGMTLTEIAQAVDPNWQTSNCKRMFKQAIDPLCLRDEVRFTVSPSGKRVKYFPTKVSKRWLLNELFNQMINAWSSRDTLAMPISPECYHPLTACQVQGYSQSQCTSHYTTLYHLILDTLSTPLLDSVLYVTKFDFANLQTFTSERYIKNSRKLKNPL